MCVKGSKTWIQKDFRRNHFKKVLLLLPGYRNPKFYKIQYTVVWYQVPSLDRRRVNTVNSKRLFVSVHRQIHNRYRRKNDIFVSTINTVSDTPDVSDFIWDIPVNVFSKRLETMPVIVYVIRLKKGNICWVIFY